MRNDRVSEIENDKWPNDQNDHDLMIWAREGYPKHRASMEKGHSGNFFPQYLSRRNKSHIVLQHAWKQKVGHLVICHLVKIDFEHIIIM